ncbi:MAG: RNA-guided endonuclease TnpB family protein [Nitriliruptorales bacterium]
MSEHTITERAADDGRVTRAVRVVLDPSPSQQRWLVSYAGSARAAYNWAVAQASDNLAVRAQERERGVPEDQLTPALSWSAHAVTARWRAVRDVVHPWHRDVSIHAFRTGLDNAAAALKNFVESRSGKRRGRRVGFPRFKKKGAPGSIRFIELADGVDHRHWINPATRSHVRLMLPQRAGDGTWERRHTRPTAQQAPGRDRRSEVAWLHTHQPDAVREVWELCESGRATVRSLTIRQHGGRWVAVFALRLADRGELRNPGAPVAWHGGAVGVDVGVAHLATLDRPVEGITDEDGHVPNPRVLERHLARLRRLDRAMSRCEKGSKNRARLLRRRAKLHGRIAATRRLALHELSRRLAGGFDFVAVEDLNRAGMATAKRRLGRALADASLGELDRQLGYKSRRSGTHLVRVGRYYPSSKTCSACGAVRAKLPLHMRTFDCDTCGVSLDRDVNAARNIRAEALRLLRGRLPAGEPVASIRGETSNGEPRPGETEPAPPPGGSGGHGSFEAATDPAVPVLAGVA